MNNPMIRMLFNRYKDNMSEPEVARKVITIAKALAKDLEGLISMEINK